MAKYQQIYEQLRKAILRGEYGPNALLPSENALAIKFGVSRITTKRVLNDLAANELIYRVQGRGSFVKPHPSIQSQKLLLVIPFNDSQNLGDYASGISETVQGTAWQVLTMTNQSFASMDLSHIHQDYAGIIYYPQSLSRELPRLIQLFLAGIPVVLLDQQQPNIAIPSVASDNIAGGRLAVEHLLATGHERIGFYTHTPFWHDFSGTVSERFFGYVNGYRQAQTTSTPLEWSKHMAHLQAAPELITYLQAEHITALIAENDIEAVQLMTQLQQHDINIPSDIAMIGFDNLPIATISQPELTTISQDFKAIGARAIDLLLAQINNPQKLFNEHAQIPVHLIQRASTQEETHAH